MMRMGCVLDGKYPAATQREHRQSGFAIGTVLLAVILIAAIVTAMAIASRGNSQNIQSEQDRLMASNMLQQVNNLNVEYTRLITNGYSPTAVTLGTNAAVPGYDLYAGNPNGVTGGTDCDSSNANCIYTNIRIFPLRAETFDGPAGRFQLRQNAWIPGVGSSQVGAGQLATGRNIVILRSDIKRGVCQNINNILHSLSIQEEPPMRTGPFAGFGFSEPENGPHFSLENPYHWSEGCLKYQGSVFDQTDPYNTYTYFRVVYVQ